MARGLAISGAVLAVVVGIWLLSDPASPCTGVEGCTTLEDLRSGPLRGESYHLYDRHGVPLASVGGERRDWIPLEQIPPTIRKAWVAVEDRRFREHGGVDFRGVARAARSNLAAGGIVEGASTIPMQLVRVIWPEATAAMGPWRRKLFELRMAPRLVSELGRDRVLELYLNGIYLGDGIHGVGLASRHYFGVPPAELDPGQVATLVGLTRAPELLHPRAAPERARARRDVVLGVLAEQGVISREQAGRIADAELTVADSSTVSRGRSYVTAAVRRELEEVAPELAERGGLHVYTTIDPEAQTSARMRLEEGLREIEAGERGRYLGADAPLQGGLVALRSGTGEILAVVGGRDFGTTQLNRPIQSRRPVGSLAKPILMSAALERGISSLRPFSTAPIAVETEEGIWTPADHVEPDHLLLRDVVVYSSNRAAVQAGQEVGARAFAEHVRSVGVETRVPHVPSAFLGAFEASLAEMTAAYAAFENGGRRVTPHLIRRVEGPTGLPLWSRGPRRGSRVMSPQSAYLVLQAMREAVDRGTGWRVRRHLGGPAAGKTGTTDQAWDAWFVGLRPGLAAGVWIGLDQPGTISAGASGGRLAAPLWGAWMSDLAELGLGAGSWSPPDGVVQVRVDLRETADTLRACWGAGEGVVVRSRDLFRAGACREEPVGPGPRRFDAPGRPRVPALRGIDSVGPLAPGG